MSGQRLIVLKLGGSVLTDESTLRLAVHEIYRWRRTGWQVIAVVSALAGRTDELLAAAERICAEVNPWAVAALVSTGELHSAGLLGLHLDRAGIPGAVIWPTSCALIAEGVPLNAEPTSVNAPLLRAALARHGVVVLPGYTAQDREGRPVVLGRGGSDLTALFVAHALGARCRLIKDVDGLYDRNPSCAGAQRFGAATFADALATDGSIVQHKAVRFAQRHQQRFELGRINGRRVTTVGAVATRYSQPERRRRLKVALLGLGTVGGGVYELLRQMPGEFEVSAVAVRDPLRPRAILNEKAAKRLTGDAIAAARSHADIVVEAIGGCGIALHAVRAALEVGSHVVTANKALIAEHGLMLARSAKQYKAGTRPPRLRYSAAVGGSMPLLERLSQLRRRGMDAVRSIRAVINGTTNFVLDRVREGLPFSEALRRAREHGFAEQDPSRDLCGLDAADKLCIMAQELGLELSAEDVKRDTLSEACIPATLDRSCDRRLRHVARLVVGDGSARGEVRLVECEPNDPLLRANDASNVAIVELADGQREMLSGIGAGRWPTAEAVVADVMAIARMSRRHKTFGSRRARRVAQVVRLTS